MASTPPTSPSPVFKAFFLALSESQQKELYEAYLINQIDVLERYVSLAVDQGCPLDSDSLHECFASLEASDALDGIALGSEALAVVTGGASNPIHRLDKGSTKKSKEGFSLVEVAIAGSMLAFATTSMAQFSISSLSSSANQAQRSAIEAAISDNIATIHHADSSLTWEQVLLAGDQQIACQCPSQYFKQYLNNGLELFDPSGQSLLILPAVTAPSLSPSSSGKLIRSIEQGHGDGMVLITYQFVAPEANIDSEKRYLELFPVFAESCHLVSPPIESQNCS